MWPWGHLAVGYLCYLAALAMRGRGEQTLATLVAVAVGTQFPDLVDKPLAWIVDVLPSGRSLGHSLLTAALVLGVLYWFAETRRHREAVFAFGVGWVSHSVADLGPEVVVELLRGDWSQLEWTTYLVWPLLPSPPYPNDDSLVRHLVEFTFDPYMVVQTAVFGAVVLAWVLRGTPGLKRGRREGED